MALCPWVRMQRSRGGCCGPVDGDRIRPDPAALAAAGCERCAATMESMLTSTITRRVRRAGQRP
jgi:hypothetical protein